MIEIEFDTRDVEVFLDRTADKALGKAVARSVNEAIRHGKTRAKVDIMNRANIKARTINKRILIDKARPNRWRGALSVSSYGSPLIDFKPRKKIVRSTGGRRVGVSVEVIKGRRKVVKGAFIAKTSNRRGIFIRKSKSRGDLEHTLTSSVYDFFKGTSFYRRSSNIIQFRFNKQFQRNFQYYLSRI